MYVLSICYHCHLDKLKLNRVLFFFLFFFQRKKKQVQNNKKTPYADLLYFFLSSIRRPVVVSVRLIFDMDSVIWPVFANWTIQVIWFNIVDQKLSFEIITCRVCITSSFGTTTLSSILNHAHEFQIL